MCIRDRAPPALGILFWILPWSPGRGPALPWGHPHLWLGHRFQGTLLGFLTRSRRLQGTLVHLGSIGMGWRRRALPLALWTWFLTAGRRMVQGNCLGLAPRWSVFPFAPWTDLSASCGRKPQGARSWSAVLFTPMDRSSDELRMENPRGIGLCLLACAVHWAPVASLGLPKGPRLDRAAACAYGPWGRSAGHRGSRSPFLWLQPLLACVSFAPPS